MGHCVAAWELTSSFASLTVMFLLLTVMSRTEPRVPHKKTDIATSQMSRNRKSHIPDSHSDHEICCRCVCVGVSDVPGPMWGCYVKRRRGGETSDLSWLLAGLPCFARLGSPNVAALTEVSGFAVRPGLSAGRRSVYPCMKLAVEFVFAPCKGSNP